MCDTSKDIFRQILKEKESKDKEETYNQNGQEKQKFKK
jgi:hypothetical protein